MRKLELLADSRIVERGLFSCPWEFISHYIKLWGMALVNVFLTFTSYFILGVCDLFYCCFAFLYICFMGLDL